MKKLMLAAAAVCALTSGAAMAQEQSPWLVRARAVYLDSDNGGKAGDAGVSINNKWIPELDVSYFFTPNIAAELVLTVPQRHKVYLDGTGRIGSLRHLPPTLLGQYHFTNFGAFKPYVGAGINYTHFSDVDILDRTVGVKKNSWGLAVQAGMDYAIDNHWSLNFDVKKVKIDTTVGAGIGKFKVDPWLIGMGVGYRF